MQKVVKAIINNTQQDLWNRFVNKNGGDFGMLWQWNSLVAEYFKHEFYPLLLIDAQDNIIDVCPFIYDKSAKKLYSGGFCTSKGGCVFDGNMGQFIQFTQKNINCLQISVLSYQQNLLPNFICANHQDIVTNLHDNINFDAFLKVVKSNLRRNYKKALRNNLTISEAKTKQDIAQFYEIYLHIMEKNNAKQVEPQAWFEWLFEHFQANQVIYFVHNQEQQIVATVWAFMNQNEVYYYAGGSLSEFASLQSGPFMLLSLYEKAFQKNIPSVNLGPVNLDTKRYQFKKKFNGEIKPTYHYYYYRNPLKQFSKKVFYLIRDYILSHPKLYEQVKKVIKT